MIRGRYRGSWLRRLSKKHTLEIASELCKAPAIMMADRFVPVDLFFASFAGFCLLAWANCYVAAAQVRSLFIATMPQA